MANEFKHGSVGSALSQAEWESVTGHSFDSQARGDLMYASSTTQLSRLAIGAAGRIFMSDGTDPTWTHQPVTADLVFKDGIDVHFGDSSDAALRWSAADADNHALVLALGDSNQGLHITDLGAIATDWNIAATTHPNVYIHSNTTPATDYLRLGGHDGTTADIDVVGGTTLRLMVDGTAEVSITGTATSPSTSDGNALGTASLMWSDLFLASGSVINWDNGDLTLTHSANTLTLAGGNVALGTGTITAAAVLANADDSGALGASGTAFSDLFLASGGVINFAAGNVTLTHSTGILTMAGTFKATSPDFTTSITTPSTTFAIANATATTVNAFGAATTVNLGAAAMVLNMGSGAQFNWNSGDVTITHSSNTLELTGGDLKVISRDAAATAFLVNSTATPSTHVAAIQMNGTNAVLFDVRTDSSELNMATRDLGNDIAGPRVIIGRNSNGTNANSGTLQYFDVGATAYYLWVDDTGVYRIHTSPPGGATADTAGTVVGDQTSWHEAKSVRGESAVTPQVALDRVLALGIYDYTLRESSYLAPDGSPAVFTGPVGYDRGDWFLKNVGPGQHPALNDVNLFGHIALAIKELDERLGRIEGNQRS